MKRLSLLFLFLLLLPTHSVEAREVRILLDGNLVETDVAPIIEQDRTLVPIRFISESMGYDVKWNQEAKEVTISGDKIIRLTVNKPAIQVAGETIPLDVAPKLVQDRTMVPLRAISEAFGLFVDWDHENYTVVLNHNTLSHLTSEEKAYFQSYLMGQKEVDGKIRLLQETMNQDFSSLSKSEIQQRLREISHTFQSEASWEEKAAIPQKMETLHKIYLQSLNSAMEITKEYEESYSGNDKNSALKLLEKFYFLNLQRSETQRVAEAISENRPYVPSESYKATYENQNSQNTGNLSSILENLFQKI